MISSAEFKEKAYPGKDKGTRGARKSLNEMSKRGFLEPRSGRYAITHRGLSLLRGEWDPKQEEKKSANGVAHEQEASPVDRLMQLARRRGVRIPAQPVTEATQMHTPQGVFYVMYGPRREVWFTRGAHVPWRCVSGDTLFELERGRVRVRPRTAEWVPLDDNGGMMHPPRSPEIFGSEDGSVRPW